MSLLSPEESPPLTAHFNVFGVPECYYHVKLQVGSTKMNLVLDTGSSNTAVISDHCKSMNCTFVQEPHLSVNPEALINEVSARYGNAKSKASWHGYATSQMVKLRQNKSFFSRIDVITGSDRFFLPGCPQNQGLWGLAYPGLQTQPQDAEYLDHGISKETLFDSARNQLDMPDSFSFQLCPLSSVDPVAAHGFDIISSNENFDNSLVTASSSDDREELEGIGASICPKHHMGHFWLGGYPSRFVQSSITWVPLVNSHYYEVSMDGFFVNNQVVEMDDNLDTQRTIVDTGTNDIILSTENLNQFLNALWKSNVITFDQSFISPEYERAFWMDNAQLTVPSSSVKLNTSTTVSVSLGGQMISIPLENLIKVNRVMEETRSSWINISWTGLSDGGNTNMAGTVLGNTLMRGKTTVWDRGGRRLGFADVDPLTCCQTSSGNDVDRLLSSLPAIDKPIRYKTSSGLSNTDVMLLDQSSSPVSVGSRFVCVLFMGLVVIACLGGLIHGALLAWKRFHVKPKNELFRRQLDIGERQPVIKIDLPLPFNEGAYKSNDDHNIVKDEEKQEREEKDYEII
ncbi:hypothetical protein INT45_000096 [Circinella minor]|uniref:Peptidase A1 domain-containing protein n=1 Tax=Circinella minor TaxID=1195481 RepID=A0A8H7VLG3_9FUNG|nr:hypothetical protein INT45_000096 [Circinella minor]